MKCKEVNSLTEGDSLYNAWLDLLDRVRPELRLFGPHWFMAWSRTVGSEGRWNGRLRVLAVRDDQDSLQAVLPIGQPTVGPLRTHSYCGYFQPWRTIVAAEDQEAAAGRVIGESIVQNNWKLLQMGPCQRDSQTTQQVLNVFRERGLFLIRRASEPLAVTEVPETWDQFREVLGSKFLRKIRYYERRMARDGDVKIDHYRQPSAEEASLMIQQLGKIEGRSWLAQAKNGCTRFIAKTDQQMWAHLIEKTLTPNDQLDCWVMSQNGRPVSFCLTLTSLPVRYVIANSFDEEFKDHRTGSTLYRHMMEDGISRGVRKFDFGTNELHYKKYWGASYRDWIDTYAVVVNRPGSAMLRAGLSVCQVLKSTLRKSSAVQTAEPELDSDVADRQTAEEELVSVS